MFLTRVCIQEYISKYIRFDIHFDSSLEIPPNKEYFRALEEASYLIATARQHRKLKSIVLIFPIIYPTTAILEQQKIFYRRLEEWNISVSCLNYVTHGDPIAACRLVVWGFHKSTILSFDPPPQAI